jgi:Tfp pilus assembly protein PilF
MSKKTFGSSLLAVVLLFAFVQHQTAANAGIFDWSALVAEQVAIEDSTAADANADGTTKDSADTSTQKKGNGFVRALSAPFRALGRLFGGGSKKNNDQQARRISNKDAEKFESTKLERIKDATTPVAPPPANPAPATPSSTAEFENYLARARQLLLAGDANGAINELTSATAINQRSAEANKLLGIAYESKGWRDSALRSFEMAVTLDENNPEHLNNLGFYLYKNGDDYERATRLLKRAAKIAKNNPRIWNNLGLVQCERGKFDDAYQSFARAVGEYQGHMSVAAQLQQRGHAKDAIKHLESAQAMQPNSTDVLNKLVSLYEMTGRHSDAEMARRSLVALKTSAEANK